MSAGSPFGKDVTADQLIYFPQRAVDNRVDPVVDSALAQTEVASSATTGVEGRASAGVYRIFCGPTLFSVIAFHCSRPQHAGLNPKARELKAASCFCTRAAASTKVCFGAIKNGWARGRKGVFGSWRNLDVGGINALGVQCCGRYKTIAKPSSGSRGRKMKSLRHEGRSISGIPLRSGYWTVGWGGYEARERVLTDYGPRRRINPR